MDEHTKIDLKPVTHITTDAIGQPGQRVFYIQGWKDEVVVSLIIEKFQIQTLAIGVEQFLAEIQQRLPDLQEASRNYEENKMHILPPVEPMFRVSEFGLSYDSNSDMIALIAREVPTGGEEQGSEVHYWCTRSQLRAMIHWGLEVAMRGRPICPQCGQPEDPQGHFCPRKNGHKH